MNSAEMPESVNPVFPEMPVEAETPAIPEEIVLDRDAMLGELLDWATRWLDKSMEWRKNSWEEQWRRWQRAADSIYDANLAAKKEKWQSKAVWPLTASHRENALASLFHIELGAKPPLEYKPRVEVPRQVVPGMPPPVDQGELIRDLVLIEREKAEYEIARNAVNEDKTTYGSGFMRARFEEKVEPRPVKVPVYEQVSLSDPMSLFRSLSGQARIIGYRDEVQDVITYRGVRLEHISIWDIFKDPKSLNTTKGFPIAHRYYETYGDIVKGAAEGYYLPEAAAKLKDLPSDEETPEDKKQVESDRQISDTKVERPDYARQHECFEIQARLPKKWVLIDGQPIDDPEALVPARLRIKKGVCVVSVAVNDTYDGEPDLEQDDYMPVAGQSYGRGIPEMLKDAQLVASETVNQRLDAGSIGLMQKFAIIESALVDPKDVDENRNVIRFKLPKGVDQANLSNFFQRIDMGGPDRTAFVEPQEWERIAQERTSVTRATLGTANQVNDSNRTLGGQEIQQGVTQDKMAFLAKLSEFGFQKRLSHRIWALIYQNYNPEDYVMALGPEKAAQLILMSPEQVAQNYRLIPKGVFEMENKARRQAQKVALQQQFGMMPWFNTLGNAKSQIADLGEDEDTYILPEADALQIASKAQEMAVGMAQQMAPPPQPEEPPRG